MVLPVCLCLEDRHPSPGAEPQGEELLSAQRSPGRWADFCHVADCPLHALVVALDLLEPGDGGVSGDGLQLVDGEADEDGRHGFLPLFEAVDEVGVVGHCPLGVEVRFDEPANLFLGGANGKMAKWAQNSSWNMFY